MDYFALKGFYQKHWVKPNEDNKANLKSPERVKYLNRMMINLDLQKMYLKLMMPPLQGSTQRFMIYIGPHPMLLILSFQN